MENQFKPILPKKDLLIENSKYSCYGLGNPLELIKFSGRSHPSSV